jgi:hypothetical protein
MFVQGTSGSTETLSQSPCPLDLPVPSPQPWQPGDVAVLDARKLFVLALLLLRPLPQRHPQAVACGGAGLRLKPLVASPGSLLAELLSILSIGRPPLVQPPWRRAFLPFQLPSLSLMLACHYAATLSLAPLHVSTQATPPPLPPFPADMTFVAVHATCQLHCCLQPMCKVASHLK